MVADMAAGRVPSAPGGGRLIVCPTPIGNLEDVTLRVLSALREADLVAARTRGARACCSIATACRPSSSATRAQRARARGELVEADAGGRGRRAGVRRGHAAGVRSRASCSCRRASRRGTRSRSCRVRRPRSPRSWRARCPPTTGTSPASCRARSASSTALFGSPRDAGRLRVAEARRGVRSRGSPSSIPSRPVAVCRELTKVHEEFVRGSSAELAARYAGRAPKGEVVLVVGAAAEATGELGAGRRRRCAASSTRARSRGPRRASCPS